MMKWNKGKKILGWLGFFQMVCGHIPAGLTIQLRH